ncbi:hypothetical protein QJQ45_008149 [Haematococcus lacustris]|nr:hypothetical protein QJQ45_008149 [Haematococcus lacustris]
MQMAKTQKNKATMGHLGSLKAKLAKLRRDLLEPSGGGGGGKGGEGFDVNKVGDARVGFVGFPSVGKSTLLTKLTGTFSEAASYEFTTLTCIPGIVRYRGAKIQPPPAVSPGSEPRACRDCLVQMLDLPGIIEGAKDGKGRGRQVISTARTCNLILIVLDCLKPLTHKRIIEKELEGFGIRLNKKPPNITCAARGSGVRVPGARGHWLKKKKKKKKTTPLLLPPRCVRFKKKDKGGINFSTTVKDPKIDLEAVKAVCSEYRINNADIFMAEDNDIDDLVDVIEGSRVYVPAIYVITLEELEVMDKLPHYCPVCAFLDWNLDGLVEMCWDYLDMVRVYTKPKGKLPDFNEPVVMHRQRSTVEDFCNKIHKSLIKQFKCARTAFVAHAAACAVTSVTRRMATGVSVIDVCLRRRYALVWGISAKHRPQRVGKDHVLQDEDILQIVKRI